MASASPNKSLVGRVAAILTNTEVAGAALDLNEAYSSLVSVDFTFTLGSLTNVIVRFYASMDGVTYDPIRVTTGVAMTETLTASGERCYTLPALVGWRNFRVSLEGTGTLTSSSAAYVYRYLRRGSQ